MSGDFDPETGDVEGRIEGEFMTKLQKSSVSFDVVDAMEGLLGKDDFGGDEQIVDAMEDALFDDGD